MEQGGQRVFQIRSHHPAGYAQVLSLDSGHLRSIPVLSPMGPRESQALLISFQSPPLTLVPGVPLLKNGCNADTVALVLPPFRTTLGCVGLERAQTWVSHFIS